MLSATSLLHSDWRPSSSISAGFTQSYLAHLNICSLPQTSAARSDSRHAFDAARGWLPAPPAAQSQSSSASARLAAPCVCYQAKEPEPISAVLSRAGKK